MRVERDTSDRNRRAACLGVVAAEPRWWAPLAACVVSVFLALPAGGAPYQVNVRSGGAAKVAAGLGQTFEVQVELQSETPLALESVGLRLILSSSGVELRGVEWAAPFVTGGIDDFMAPERVRLPLVLTAASLTSDLYPSEDIDVYLSNFALGPVSFRTGAVVTLRCAIAASYAGFGKITMRAEAEGLSGSAAVAEAVGGSSLEVTVSPGPGGMVPALQMGMASGILVLSWPAALGDLVLESSTRLGAGAEWLEVGTLPQRTSEDRMEVRVAADDTSVAVFYRLRERP